MAFDTNAFITDILKDVSVDDATKATLTQTLSNPIIAKRLEDSTLRQSDYSKQMNEYNTKIKAAEEYWNGLVKWDKEAKQKLDQERALLKQQLVNDGIDPDKIEHNRVGVGQEELQRLAQEAIAYNNAIVTLGLKHYKEFGDILDTDELLKVAGRDKVNVTIAYDRMTQPKRAELQQVEIQKQIAQAREEGKAEALKNVQIPVAEQPFTSGVPHALDRLDRVATNTNGGQPEYGAMAAVKAFSDNLKKSKLA